ncbi:MAG: hypothetical protein P4L78_12660 [Silvimonas sp.]|nr:hypothetical protein [Silvimonas sp.]
MAWEIVSALEKEMGRSLHPLEALLRIGHDTKNPLELRCTCLRDCLPYVLPRLQQQSVALSGPSGGPVELATLDVSAILANPALAETAQQLAMMVIDQEVTEERAGLPAPVYKFPEYK